MSTRRKHDRESTTHDICDEGEREPLGCWRRPFEEELDEPRALGGLPAGRERLEVQLQLPHAALGLVPAAVKHVARRKEHQPLRARGGEQRTLDPLQHRCRTNQAARSGTGTGRARA